MDTTILWNGFLFFLVVLVVLTVYDIWAGTAFSKRMHKEMSSIGNYLDYVKDEETLARRKFLGSVRWEFSQLSNYNKRVIVWGVTVTILLIFGVASVQAQQQWVRCKHTVTGEEQVFNTRQCPPGWYPI